MKFYRGSGRGARAYVEADHHRADDYYLADGAGIAEMIRVDGRTGGVLDRMQLDGDAYESWVEGVDVATGLDKGHVRTDAHALRFAEVIVNGPKSWSLAAGLHPDISAALDAAQDRAVQQIGQYIATHVCTRVGSRGKQRQVRVQQVEMAAIRHYTSRGGDPHRHLHLQINARVPAAGKWRGIDSAQLLRMQRAINGIGHRAVLADPEFRAALAAHGYTVGSAGEIVQLAAAVPAMSKRSAQVAANIERYERQWRTEHPGAEPGPGLLRAWDERGWADKREAKKNHPTRGPECETAWIGELRSLGVDVDAQLAAAPTGTGGMPVGAVDRDEAADRVLKVLGAGGRGRSTWNVYDIRGVTEEVLAARHVIAPPRVFQELAEDVAARAEAQCLSVVDRPVPEHIRHLTSQAVIDLERDLHGRLAVRGAVDHTPATVQDVAAALVLPAPDGTERVLGEGQVAAARAIAGTGPVVLIEGAAGAGKTTVLAVANDIITAHGHTMMVVAPSKKASMIAADQIGADASTAARLAYQHGYRWDEYGVWTRLRPGDLDPVSGTVYTGPHSSARLTAGDVLVIDEAGMLDQETARALLRIADAADARVVYVGDRRQLPAVGRGGVLDMAAQWATTQMELAAVHRFRTPDGHLDTQYADLTLRIRSGIDPEAVFDDLNAGGHIKVWDSEADALGHLAVQTTHRRLHGVSQAVAVDTNDTAAAVNEVVRDQLVTAGAVDDATVTHGSDGLRIGKGDHVMTRHNNPDLGVANRMTWTVQGIADTGAVQLQNADRRQDAAVDADYVRQYLHLAYASTVHGVQGDTADHADSLLTDSTDAAAAYVALSRGRYTNTVHIVAGTLDEAREKWLAAAGRNRADLGLDQARAAVASEARNYAAITDQQQPRREPAGGNQSSFADRIRQVAARLDVERTRYDIAVDAPVEQDEWNDEHRDHHTPTQSGPHL